MKQIIETLVERGVAARVDAGREQCELEILRRVADASVAVNQALLTLGQMRQELLGLDIGASPAERAISLARCGRDIATAQHSIGLLARHLHDDLWWALHLDVRELPPLASALENDTNLSAKQPSNKPIRKSPRKNR
jgi:hypothetical protein